MSAAAKMRFDKDLLDSVLKRDKAHFVQNLSDKYTKTSIIQYVCQCGAIQQKNLRSIYRNFAICSKCSSSRQTKNKILKIATSIGVEPESVTKATHRSNYDEASLRTILKRDDAQLIKISDAIIVGHTFISFFCRCGREHSKKMKYLQQYNAICADCTDHQKQENMNTTCMDRYGVKSVFLDPDIKNKCKQSLTAKFGDEHSLSNSDVRQKIINTMQAKYGVDYPAQLDRYRFKLIEWCRDQGPSHASQMRLNAMTTNLERYGHRTYLASDVFKQANLRKFGVDHHFKLESVRAKRNKTMLEKFGVEHPIQNIDIQSKMQQTVFNRYGVDHASQSLQVRQNKIKTCLKRYGVQHPSQNPVILGKILRNSLSRKEYVFKDGSRRSIQGYEHFALKKLENQGIEACDIKTNTTDVPEIWYSFNDSRHRYFTDIYLPGKLKVIEIKSIWTLANNLHRNLAKLKAAELESFSVSIWCYDHRGRKLSFEETCSKVSLLFPDASAADFDQLQELMNDNINSSGF